MIKKLNPLYKFSILLLLIILIGTTAYISIRQKNASQQKEQQALLHKKKFICSMHPQVVQDKPGDCPLCGMALIEKIEQDANGANEELNNVVNPVNETVLASVQTVSANKTELPLTIEASGLINFDSRRISTISARFGGLIEKSFIKYPFQYIHKGDKIFDIYCPDIFKDKSNYILMLKAYPDHKLSREAYEWVLNLGLTEKQIDDISKADKPNYHLSVYSDCDGFAVNISFNPEQYFTPGSSEKFNTASNISVNNGIGLNDGLVIEKGLPLFKVVNTESIRADLKVRTEDAGLLKLGQNVILSDAVSPDRNLNATVSQIEPLNGGLFQLVKVYISDQKKLLIPGRQIQAHIRAGKHNGLWLPKTAVINLGQRQTVFLKHDNTFIATNIQTGLQSGDMIEIRSGIDPKAQIALNASLLTDSDGFIKTNSK